MINWKLRLKNKVTLVTLLAAIVAFVYQLLGIFEVVPAITQDDVKNVIGIVINLLVGLGIIVDPTTKGVGDSNTALHYEKPSGEVLTSMPELVDDGDNEEESTDTTTTDAAAEDTVNSEG